MSAKDASSTARRESIGSGAGEAARRPFGGLVIETARLILRAPAMPDAAAIAELADTPRVAEMLVGMPHPYRVSDALAWIGERSPQNGQKHLVCLKTGTGPVPVGAATLDFRRDAPLATLGCWFGEAHWGRGFGTEAAHAVIDYAFLHQGHERLSFTCRVTNMAGRRVIEKCGFQLAAQELCPSAFLNAVVPVDRFTLDRRTWESLRRWEPLRFAAGPAAENA